MKPYCLWRLQFGVVRHFWAYGLPYSKFCMSSYCAFLVVEFAFNKRRAKSVLPFFGVILFEI